MTIFNFRNRAYKSQFYSKNAKKIYAGFLLLEAFLALGLLSFFSLLCALYYSAVISHEKKIIRSIKAFSCAQSYAHHIRSTKNILKLPSTYDQFTLTIQEEKKHFLTTFKMYRIQVKEHDEILGQLITGFCS